MTTGKSPSLIGVGVRDTAAVALPLAMAFAIASGLKPEAGIFTAIIAGLLISLLGGSPVQIGGPAGAFIVIVYGIVERFGLANLIIATAMSGVPSPSMSARYSAGPPTANGSATSAVPLCRNSR